MLVVGAWAERGPDYLRLHWQSAAGSVALIFSLATMIAVRLYVGRTRNLHSAQVTGVNTGQ